MNLKQEAALNIYCKSSPCVMCVQYIGGYHELIGGCSVHRGDVMMQVGEQVDKSLSISIENL